MERVLARLHGQQGRQGIFESLYNLAISGHYARDIYIYIHGVRGGRLPSRGIVFPPFSFHWRPGQLALATRADAASFRFVVSFSSSIGEGFPILSGLATHSPVGSFVEISTVPTYVCMYVFIAFRYYSVYALVC